MDLDQEVERATGRPISALFEEEGEDFFRIQEAAVLRLVGLGAPLVLATGGGTPCFHDSLDWLLAHGPVVWLDVPPAVIVGRLVRAPAASPPGVVPGNRPLLAAAAAASPQATETMLLALLTQTLSARAPFYARAPHHLRADNPTVAALRNELRL